MHNYLIILYLVCLMHDNCAAQINKARTTVSTTSVTTHEFRYTNPITRDTALSMRDHFFIKVGSKWYCTGTSEPVWTGLNPGLRILVSDELIQWKQHSFIIDAKTLGNIFKLNL